MPQIINTNIASINAQRNLDRSQSDNQQALQRLSSGLRINSARDDAAGLAISTRFTSQINGLSVATRNAGDGIALAQTAEGALGSINDNLQRIRELAVQSANATNSDVDRDALQSEVDQLVAEITRTSEETDFNGRNLLDGSFAATFQIGANAGQTVDISIAELTADRLGSSSQSGLSAQGTDNALGNGDLNINGVAISASRASDDTASTSNNSASAISKVAAINRFSDETGVTAFVNDNVAAGTQQQTVAGGSGTFTLNGVDISFSTSSDAAQTRAGITQAINAVAEQTGIQAVDTDNAATGINLVAEDGRNIDISFDTADLSGGLTAANFAAATGLAGGAVDLDGTNPGTVFGNTYEGGYTLIADGDRNSIEISGGNGTGRGDLANAGLTEGTFDRGVATSVTAAQTSTEGTASTASGSLNGAISRTDSGGSFISLTGATVTSLVTSTATAAQVTASQASLTISDGRASTAVVFTNTSGNTSIAEYAFQADAARGANEVNFFEQGTFDIGGLGAGAAGTGGASFLLGGVNISVVGTSAEARAESVLNAINSSDFSTAVGATGYVNAELNSAGDTVSITVRNETSTSLAASNSATTGSQVTIGGVTLNTGASASILSGELGFESTSASGSAVSVVLSSTSGELLNGVTTQAAESVSGVVNTSTQETNINVNLGGQDVSVAGSPLQAGSSVAQLANAVNSVDGVTAFEEINLTITASTLESGESLRIQAGANSVDISATADSAGNFTLAQLADDVNGATTNANLDVSAVYDADADSISLTIRNFTSDTVTLDSENADGAGVVLSQGGGTFVGEQEQSVSGQLQFFSDDGRDVTVTLSDPQGTGGELFANNSDSATFSGVNGLQDGDLLINGVTIGGADAGADTASATRASDGTRILSSEKGQSAIAVAAAINEVADETGVTATVNATTVTGGDGTNAVPGSFESGDQAGLFINGVNIGVVTLQNEGSGTTVDANRARADALNLINQNAGKTGVTAEDNGVSLTLTAADGRNVSIAIDDRSGSSDSIGAIFGLDANEAGIGETTFGTGDASTRLSSEASTYETTYGTVKLTSASEFTVAGGANGNGELEAVGLSAGTFGGGEDGQFLTDIDISTFEGATAAITAIDNAIGQVASQRADLGAIQNRLESTVSNLQITSENLNAANSRIRDADFAAETAELQRTNVLQQAGISVLAQANAAGQQVLSLLG
ncbi:flagellin [Bacterioplanoides sp.]|uniref:flagellin N-terminal helical domain-containing protein n=1 Tax=Bacterioplanoides sp. TaxID=2066072 RepID=UPI003B00F902